MPSDEETINSLIKGLKGQKQHINSKITQEVDAEATNIKNWGELNNDGEIHSYSHVEVNAIFSPDLINDSISKLEDLQELSDSPTQNESKIGEIYDWFGENVPLIQSVLSTLHIIREIGLA